MTDLPFVVSLNSLVNCFLTDPFMVPLGMTRDRDPLGNISSATPAPLRESEFVPQRR